jgi:hypothetical protein
MMRIAILTAFLVACGSDTKPQVVEMPSPEVRARSVRVDPTFTFADLAEASCSSSSDCAGYGNCSGGKCGVCSSSSDCNGHGNCSNGKCGSCSSSSDCKIGNCSSGRCGACSSSSDCKGGTCSSGRCSNYPR